MYYSQFANPVHDVFWFLVFRRFVVRRCSGVNSVGKAELVHADDRQRRSADDDHSRPVQPLASRQPHSYGLPHLSRQGERATDRDGVLVASLFCKL